MFYQGTMASSIIRQTWEVGQEVQQIYAGYTGKIVEIERLKNQWGYSTGEIKIWIEPSDEPGKRYPAYEREVRDINWK
jgi:hypothetical protein